MQKEFSQLDIITILYFYSKNFHAYMMRIEPEFFNDANISLFAVIQTYYKSFDKVPPKSAILIECDIEEKDSLSVLYDQMVSAVDNVKNYTHDYIVEKLDAFVKKNFLKRFLLNSYDQFEQGKYDQIIESVSSLRESIIDNDFGQEYHDDSFFTHRYESEQTGSFLPTGYQQFDESFSGWHKKSLNVIAGPANSGKTLWLINFVTRRLLDEKKINNKILYITLEIDSNQVGRRIDSCLTGRPSKELWNKRDQGVRELIALSKETMGNRVMIKSMPGYKTTTSDIEACIRNLDIVSNGELKPNLVVIDYLGLLSPAVVNKNMGLYEKGLNIAVELRSLAQQYNIPFIVAAQTNRSSFSDRPGMENMSDSIGISQTADLILTINRNESLDQNNQVEIYLAKSRFSRNGLKFIFSVDYNTMQANDIMGDVPNTVDDEL